MNKIELLAPSGNLEKAKIAILYGADAVYIGGKQFSLRSRASNFSIDEIAELVKFANAHNSHVHVTVNMLPHESDLDGIEEYLKTLDSIGVHAIIVASPSIMMLAKKLGCTFEVHVSTQHSSTNSSAARFWKEKGMDRVVLARECQMDDIRSICEENILPIEVFIHGGMCISFSGRCVLSNHMTLRDANRGGCAQSCRWKYHLMDGQTELSDPTNLFSMSSKDLQAVDYIEDFIHMGVASLKIEGRMKSAYYLATVVSSYRMLIDYIYEHYDHFRLLFKCGDSGKYEAFIHNMVNKEMKATKKYMQIMKEAGMDLLNVDESLMHMIYTGFFSSVLQIVEHDMDKEIAKKNVHQLKEFNTGGWERIWNIQFK